MWSDCILHRVTGEIIHVLDVENSWEMDSNKINTEGWNGNILELSHPVDIEEWRPYFFASQIL